jgi:hypothetical protein
MRLTRATGSPNLMVGTRSMFVMTHPWMSREWVTTAEDRARFRGVLNFLR